ncbi:MAG: trehalase family glycosidase [Bacillota bacterium]|nr:trehalase family glycosidase [Bacillota bacterium]
MYVIPTIIAALLLYLIWLIYRKQFQNLVRPLKYKFSYSGGPPYIAGSTNGSPLSDLGSHCGFKAVPERSAACSSALFATVTSFGAGRLCDFAVCLHTDQGSKLFDRPRTRKVHFQPYCIEEEAADGEITLRSKLFFLQNNLALLDITWETEENDIKVKPELKFKPISGRDLENPYPHFNGFTFYREAGSGLQLSNYHRWPGQKVHAFFLASNGGRTGHKEIEGVWFDLSPAHSLNWSVVISFSADGDNKVVARAERAMRCLEKLKSGSIRRWNQFESRLPVPAAADMEQTKGAFRLAAWSLQNSLYYPRGSMTGWGSVPAKVYFPFIWGWDTPQHVIGLSEWNPKKAGEILLTQFSVNSKAPEKRNFKLKAGGITIISRAVRNQIPSKLDDSLRGVLDFYSQPPLQSWAAVRVYERLKKPEDKVEFLRKVLPPLQGNIRWWEDNRRLGSGFFSYINGLESGLDDSPRFYPPSFLPSFIIGLVPRLFCAVDLNCWLYQSYTNASYLAGEAGLIKEASTYKTRAAELSEKIDNELWSPEHDAWLDRQNGKFIEVVTPAIWWPAFVGASKNLSKIRAVIERYLLKKDKFWGEYGIPSVAYDDHSYNSRKDGYYWRGQIWMINNYAALELLYRFGYEREAAELHERIMKTIFTSQGLYETYNANTGVIGWSSRGPGDPAVMQFGMSSAWATQIVFYRYQHFRYIFPDTNRIEGHIQWATTFDRVSALSPPCAEENPCEAIMQVSTNGSHHFNLPKIRLASSDNRALLKSEQLRLRFEDPNGFTGSEGKVTFIWKGEAFEVSLARDYCFRPEDQNNKMSEIKV